MPKISNYEDWDDLEENYAEEDKRNKISHKSKKHDKKEWTKVDAQLQKENKVKFVKNKRRKAHKKNSSRTS
jgi:hypothetical protein